MSIVKSIRHIRDFLVSSQSESRLWGNPPDYTSIPGMPFPPPSLFPTPQVLFTTVYTPWPNLLVSSHAQQPPFVCMCACCVCACTLHRRIPYSYMDLPPLRANLGLFRLISLSPVFPFPLFPLAVPFRSGPVFTARHPAERLYKKKARVQSAGAGERQADISKALALNLFPLRILIISERARVGNSEPFVYFTDMN